MNSLRFGFFSFLFTVTCSAFTLSFDLYTGLGGGFTTTLVRNYNASYAGVYVFEKGRMLLVPRGSYAQLTLTPINPEIKAQLSKLKSGDYLSVEGLFDQVRGVLHVGSVNYVGLKDLVGNWHGDDEYCYKFKDFSIMSIHHRTDDNKCDFSIQSLAREFSYFINPAYMGWSMLLSDNDDSYLIDLTLNSKNSAELSLYDSRSGDILRQIRIRR